jgi:hypothetical protein
MARGVRYRISPALNLSTSGIVLGGGGSANEQTTHAVLGRLGEQGTTATIRFSFGAECVMGIFGKRGMGKSYTLGGILEALACANPSSAIGCNQGDRAVLVLDTLNIYQYSVVPVSQIVDPTLRSRAQDRLKAFGLTEQPVEFDVSFPAGENLAFYPSEYQPFALDTAQIRPEDYAHIFELDLYRDPMGQLLLAAYDAIKQSGYRAQHATRTGSAAAGLAELIECVTLDPDLDQAFAADTRRALLSRLNSLFRLGLFSASPTFLADLLRPGRVRILLLGQLSPPLRSVVAGLLLRQLFQVRAAAAEASKMLRLRSNLEPEKRQMAEDVVRRSPPRTLVCIDEAQGYAPPTKANPCSPVLIQFVKEGRNHGLSLCFTSQQPSAIHAEVLSQVDSVIAHRLTVPSDIEAVLKNAKGRSPEKIGGGGADLTEADVLRELGEGQAWISHADAPRSLILEVRPRVTAHGGIEG